MKQTINVLLFVALGSHTFSQTSFQKFLHNNNTYELGEKIINTFDNNLVFTGYTSSASGGADICLIKINHLGDTLWAKSFGGNAGDIGEVIIQTADSGFAIGGHTRSFGQGAMDAFLLKTDRDGNLEWMRVVGTTSTSERVYGIVETPTNDLAICGYGYNFDGFVMMYDKNGVLQFKKYLSGLAAPSLSETPFDMKLLPSGDLLICGTANTYPYMCKVSSTGGYKYGKTFTGITQARFRQVIVSKEGGYLFAGEIQASNGLDNVFVVKTDTSGTPIWAKEYELTNQGDAALHVIQDPDSNYVIAGKIDNFDGGFAMKISVNGDTLWTTGLQVHPTNNNYFAGIARSLNGYMLTGQKYNGTNTDIWLTKLDQNGFPGSCNTYSLLNNIYNISLTTGSGGSTSNNAAISISANPTVHGPMFSIDTACTYNACVLSSSAFIASTYNGADVSCNGAADGSASVSLTGGTPGYQYQWSANTGSQTTATATGLGAGTYSVTVTDTSGCTTTDSITLVDPPVVIATIASSTNPTCFGYKDGSAVASGSGGTGTLTYSWNPGGGTSTTLSNMPAGVLYTCTATDANGCNSNDTITLQAPAQIDTSVSKVSNVLTANASASNYQWIDCDNGNAQIPGATSASYTAPANGSFAVIITVSGCIDTSGCHTVTGVGTNQYSVSDGITIYPNPVESGTNILVASSSNVIKQVVFHNMTGAIVKRVVTNTHRLNLSVEDLAPGMYTMCVHSANQSVMPTRVIVH